MGEFTDREFYLMQEAFRAARFFNFDDDGSVRQLAHRDVSSWLFDVVADNGTCVAPVLSQEADNYAKACETDVSHGLFHRAIVSPPRPSCLRITCLSLAINNILILFLL